MYELTVHTGFNAIHALHMPDGRREPMHGHDWQVCIVLAAERLNEHGWVMDFHEAERLLRRITEPLHQTSLNDHATIGAGNPTAERVAGCIAEALLPELPAGVTLRRVSVTEAPGCVATYKPQSSAPRPGPAA
jgi:6-pyruvoyltetrahydropterin/6-carboxytetrahydropterin synthase